MRDCLRLRGRRHGAKGPRNRRPFRGGRARRQLRNARIPSGGRGIADRACASADRRRCRADREQRSPACGGAHRRRRRLRSGRVQRRRSFAATGQGPAAAALYVQGGLFARYACDAVSCQPRQVRPRTSSRQEAARCPTGERLRGYASRAARPVQPLACSRCRSPDRRRTTARERLCRRRGRRPRGRDAPTWSRPPADPRRDAGAPLSASVRRRFTSEHGNGSGWPTPRFFVTTGSARAPCSQTCSQHSNRLIARSGPF